MLVILGQSRALYGPLQEADPELKKGIDGDYA
jgi:hypothetical protein